MTSVREQHTTVRSSGLGVIPGLAENYTSTFSLGMFRKICCNRDFEEETARVFDTGIIKAPVYLSVGQEHIPAAISSVTTEFLIFAQHRAHSYYLSFGGDIRALIDELLHRETGCARGMGGSASIHSPAIGMYGHSGHMGDEIPIAVGAAIGSGKRVLAEAGDAAIEEDYIFGALGYAATKKAPVLFICEDNDLSILTPQATRRSWNMVDIAKAFGMPALDITDDPWLIAHHVENMLGQLPAFINIRTCRHRWHAGTGTDGDPEWNRFLLIKEQLKALGLERDAQEIEEEAQAYVKRVWEEQLQRP